MKFILEKSKKKKTDKKRWNFTASQTEWNREETQRNYIAQTHEMHISKRNYYFWRFCDNTRSVIWAREHEEERERGRERGRKEEESK